MYATNKNITNYLCNKIYIKELFNEVEFQSLFTGEDACVLLQLYSKAEKTITIPDSLYYYVQTEDSLCRGKYSLKKLDSIKAGEFMYNYLNNRFPILANFYKLYICSYSAQNYCNLATSDIENKEKYMENTKQIFNKYFSIFNTKLLKVSLK